MSNKITSPYMSGKLPFTNPLINLPTEEVAISIVINALAKVK
jgi:hypothetical protein